MSLDRSIGAVIGLAVGDALGAGYEFTHPGPDESIEMRGGGVFAWAPGEWTDDTQMAICILEEAAAGPLDPARVGDRFIAWAASDPRDIGSQTSWVLSGVEHGVDLTERAAEYCKVNPRCAGNGSLMRTAPVALASPGDASAIATSARAISDLTHADPMCGDACVLWCLAIDHAVQTGEFDVTVGLDHLPDDRRSDWSGIIDAAESEPPGSFIPNGWVVTAFQAAWAAIHQTPGHGLVDSLVTAVRIGDDTDTVAAIAGSLLGARWGAEHIPKDWLDILHGWPGYRTPDLVALATSAAGQASR